VLVDASEQLLGLNEPPAPPSLHVTVPVGDEGDEAVSSTEAANDAAMPDVTEDGFGDTPVVVG